MKRRLYAKLLLASLATIPLAVTAAPASAQNTISPSQQLTISIGRGELVSVPGAMADVFVANDEVADVQVKSKNQLYVFGKSGGETTIYASNAHGDVIWSANVRVGSNIDSVDQMLNLAMPDAKVSVNTMGNNTYLLTGTVKSPEDAAEAERLVKAFVGDDTNVISRLTMATPLQVNLQVRIAEVSRSFVRTLGVNLASASRSNNGFQFGIGQGRPNFYGGGNAAVGLGVGLTPQGYVPDPNNPGQFLLENGQTINPVQPGTTIGAIGKFLGLDIRSAIDAAETEGLVTTLASPNLTALSGETAEFLAGGEFPIPISQGLGTTTVEYRKYGVSLAYTPTVLSSGRISLRVRPEVSELSSQGAVRLNGFEVPALVTRRAETTIELGSGQSFMIAGLMNNNSQRTIEKLPGAGDLPILGNLFRSQNFRRGNTELVIVVTPYLVKPVNANDISLPTDGFRKASAAQELLGMRDNAGVTGGSRPKPTAVGPAPGNPVPYAPLGAATRPTPPAVTAQPTKTKKRKGKKQAEASAAPGFSF